MENKHTPEELIAYFDKMVADDIKVVHAELQKGQKNRRAAAFATSKLLLEKFEAETDKEESLKKKKLDPLLLSQQCWRRLPRRLKKSQLNLGGGGARS